MRMSTKYFSLAFGAVIAFALPVSRASAYSSDAAAAWNTIGGNFRLGADFGGERLVTVDYSDGSSSELRTATYMTLGLGLTVIPWRHEIHALQLDASAAAAGWNTGSGNSKDSVSLNRFPLELLASYRIDLGPSVSLRAGGGVSYHIVLGMNGSGSLSSMTYDIDNALGVVGELSLLYLAVGFHLRYTSMKYTFPSILQQLDASSVGFAFTLCLPPGGSGTRQKQ